MTGVSFGGVAGTGVTQSGGTWSVQTPASGGVCGPVDVVVAWTQLSVVHSATYFGGYFYGTVPSITAQPASDTILYDATFTATVGVAGDTAPTVQWQSSTDGGTIWTDVPGATGTTLTAPNVTVPTEYRAVATNCFGAGDAATSNAATANLQTTVTFDSRGGSTVAPQTVDYNTTASVPVPPTRTGYAFDGWYTATTGGTLWDFATPITSDTTVYAQWTIDQYTVTFDSQGGSTVAPQTVDYDTPATAPAAPTSTGSTFAGGFTAATGGTQWDFTMPITADLILYAHWTPLLVITHTVTFAAPGGSAVAPQTVSVGTPATVPAAPTRSGYAFDGWFSAASGGTQWTFTDPVTTDLTLYAHWHTSGALAFTGTDALSVTGYALALLVAGGILLLVRVRRRPGAAVAQTELTELLERAKRLLGNGD